jgi:hypothetical protein
MRITFLLLAAALPALAAETIEGSWSVNYAGGIGMKTMGGAEFTFHVDGGKLTGMASVGMGWPGVAPISEGRVDGGRLDFMVYGQRWSSSGYPEMHFTGTVSGDKIQISMLRFLHGEHDGDTVTSFEGRRAKAGEVNIPVAIGTFVDGRYHHDLTGTEFTIPKVWDLAETGPSSGGGQKVGFRNAFTVSSYKVQLQGLVWLKPQTAAPERLADVLETAMDSTAAERQKTATGYRMLPATLEHRTVGGQPTVTVQAEYFENSVLMMEYHTWVMSAKTHIHVSARMPAKDFAEAKADVDSFLATFLVP